MKKYKRCNLCEKLFEPKPNLQKIAKICPDCRTERILGQQELTKIYKKLSKNPTAPSEDEMFFEDDPRALKEKDYQKYYKKYPSFVPKKDIIE